MNIAEIYIATAKRTQFVSITSKVAKVISSNGWQDEVITIFVPHTTAGITINENADPPYWKYSKEKNQDNTASGLQSFSRAYDGNKLAYTGKRDETRSYSAALLGMVDVV